jgi:hypothetical protein
MCATIRSSNAQTSLQRSCLSMEDAPFGGGQSKTTHLMCVCCFELTCSQRRVCVVYTEMYKVLSNLIETRAAEWIQF